jgi:hypothetical protein
LILLTALGVVTVFWEPLAALAGGAQTSEAVGEARATNPGGDGGASAAVPPSTMPSGGGADASSSS